MSDDVLATFGLRWVGDDPEHCTACDANAWIVSIGEGWCSACAVANRPPRPVAQEPLFTMTQSGDPS